MYKEIYSAFKETIEDQLKVIYDSKRILQKRIHTYDFIKSLQEMLIIVGETVEKWPIKNKKIIRLFENMCEELFQLSEKADDISLADKICQDIENIEKTLEDSCSVNDVELAFVCIVRNEARYIKEWINFHRIVGVKHFYIYDNGSTDNIGEILAPFIEDGIVDLIPYPGNFVQEKSYNEAASKYKYECKYMGFIDADEFVTPLIEGKKIYEIIDELEHEVSTRIFCENYGFGGIGINWRMYGTSFNKTEQSGYLVDNYIYRAEDRYVENSHIKTILNPRIDFKFVHNPHIPEIYSRHLVRSENGTVLLSPWMFDARYDKIQITHYYTKSEEEFGKKIRRGWPNLTHREVSDEDIESAIKRREELNAMKDTYMMRFSEQLREME